MGIFNNLFKKKEENTEAVIHQQSNNKHFTSENDFLEKFGAIALEKQRNLFTVTNGLSWNVDMDKEEITFGDHLTFPMQVLGRFLILQKHGFGSGRIKRAVMLNLL